MDMILGDMPFDDFHIVSAAYLSYQLPRTCRDKTAEDLLAVLRYPYDVVFDIIDGM